MEYLLLITDQDFDGDEWTPELADFGSWISDARAQGLLRGGNRLKPHGEATVVRCRNDTLVTDAASRGPRDWIAGYDIVEADTLEDAIELASRHPRARTGHVTIHPTWPVGFDEGR